VGERLDFTHDRIREVAYDLQIAPRRKLMHAKVADAIEDLYGEDLEPHSSALALHCRRAGLWERAIAYFRRAGHAAARRAAHREAISCFEQALEAMQHVPNRDDLSKDTIDLRFALRTACVAVGDVLRAAGHLREAQAAAEQLGDRHRLGWTLAYRSNSHLLLGENDKAIDSGRRAVAIARELADPKLRIAAHLYCSLTCQIVGDYRLAVDLMRESIGLESDLAARGDKPAQQIYTRTAGVLSLAELGEFSEGIARGEEALALAESADRPYAIAHVCFGIGFLYLRKADLSRAIRALKRGVRVCRSLDAPLLATALGALLGYGYGLSGRPREGISLIDAAVQVFSNTLHSASGSLLLLGEAQLLNGCVEEARSLALRAVGITRARSERGYEGWALRLLGAAAPPDSPFEAETAYGHALARAEELGMLPLRARCHLERGRLRRRLGDHERAHADLSTAANLFRRMAMSASLAEAETALRGDDPGLTRST